jgi:hypothetical protein
MKYINDRLVSETDGSGRFKCMLLAGACSFVLMPLGALLFSGYFYILGFCGSYKSIVLSSLITAALGLDFILIIVSFICKDPSYIEDEYE